MVILMVQRGPQDVRILDHIEDSNRTLDWYVAQIEKRPYRWGTDYLPHDGRTKNFQTGKSTEQLLREMGRRDVRVLGVQPIEEGIKAARMVFPRCFFDSHKTARLVECLKRYRRDINNRTGEAVAPLHDEFSHSADAFRYLGQAVSIMPSAGGGASHDYEPPPPPDWRM
jgi:phage terminase large subunit